MVPHEFVTTAFELPGYRMKRNFGVVRGIVVRSRSIVGTIGASLQTIVGGNISLFSNLCEQTRSDAFDLMLQHAEALGANAVIGARYDATEIMQGVTEVLAYGTAVEVERIHRMKIPFTKAHGAKNDFLFTWRRDAPDPAASDHAALARAICDRHTGIGADGWMLVDPPMRSRCRRHHPALQLRWQHRRDVGQRHALRRGLPDSPRPRRRRGPRAHRRGHQDAAPAEAPRARVRIRNEHGPRRRSPPRVSNCRSPRGPRDVTAALGGQSAMRRAGGQFRFRLARDGRRNRTPPALPQSHQRVVREGRWTITPSTCASRSAGRGRP